MATFEVKVCELKVKEHPNADALELAVVGDYLSCVRKGDFKTGDLAVYIPEGAVLQDWLIERLGLTGKLAGPQHNRVKAVKLRGILSQGLIYPVDTAHDFCPRLETQDGFVNITNEDDVADILGITKYIPPIPTHMSGEVFNAFGYTLKYDIENIKKFPDVLQPNEPLLITEKLHGTWTCFGRHPEIPHPIVTSKGHSENGLAFKMNDANKLNLYIMALENSVDDTGKTALDRVVDVIGTSEPVYLLGETYGKGVQDLHYGLSRPDFRAFDIYVGHPGQGRYLPGGEFLRVCAQANVETVPVLMAGDKDREAIPLLTDGQETISGGVHTREGIVIRPYEAERTDIELGRVILKSVSEKYLLRKNKDATEFN